MSLDDQDVATFPAIVRPVMPQYADKFPTAIPLKEKPKKAKNQRKQ